MNLSTYSVVAYCGRTGEIGCAVATALPAVGSICPFSARNIGMVTSQSWVNPILGEMVLMKIAEGVAAQKAIDDSVASDGSAELRQIACVDRSGGVGVFTGSECTGEAGHRTGHHFSCQGNMLTSTSVIDKMFEAMTQSVEFPLSERLMMALEAGDSEGGDYRGKQSACLKVLSQDILAKADLRVDDHIEPVKELRRILEVSKKQLFPFLEALPSRRNYLGNFSEDLIRYIGLPPAER